MVKIISLASIGALTFATALILKLFRNSKKFKIGNKNEKIIIITGCDSGLGRLAVLHLAQHQYTLIACFLDPICPSAIQLRDLYPTRVHIVSLDLLKSEDIEDFKSFLANELRSENVWALVNMAARTNYLSPVHLTSDQLMVRSMEVNFFGAVRMVKVVLPWMQAGARIVNISSLTARLHFKNLSMYCASKAALEALSDCLRLELKERKIFVSVLRPSGFLIDSCADDVLEAKSHEVVNTLHSELNESETAYNLNETENKNAIKNIYTAFKSTMLKHCSKDTSPFTDNLLRCIESQNPSAYYYVGRSSLFLSILSHIMPCRFLDWMCS